MTKGKFELDGETYEVNDNVTMYLSRLLADLDNYVETIKIQDGNTFKITKNDGSTERQTVAKTIEVSINNGGESKELIENMVDKLNLEPV